MPRSRISDPLLTAASVRDAVADANPKHAEFIVDSPLEWYADGPIDDVMAEWDDECALGLGGVGWGGDLGEGLGGEDGDWAEGADAVLEDWADAVYEADMGCM